jgi:hypothetical protein
MLYQIAQLVGSATSLADRGRQPMGVIDRLGRHAARMDASSRLKRPLASRIWWRLASIAVGGLPDASEGIPAQRLARLAIATPAGSATG